MRTSLEVGRGRAGDQRIGEVQVVGSEQVVQDRLAHPAGRLVTHQPVEDGRKLGAGDLAQLLPASGDRAREQLERPDVATRQTVRERDRFRDVGSACVERVIPGGLGKAVRLTRRHRTQWDTVDRRGTARVPRFVGEVVIPKEKLD